MRMHVEVYTKSGCSLCDDAIDLLRRKQRSHSFSLALHDIADRAEWFSAFRYRVPVICIDGVECCALRIEEETLTKALVAAERGV